MIGSHGSRTAMNSPLSMQVWSSVSCDLRHAKLDSVWITTGVRKGTKYTHPVKSMRHIGTCTCGWSTGMMLTLPACREAMKEHERVANG